MDLHFYLHDNIPSVVPNFDNMFQETTFVLIGQPQFSIFDQSCIFIGCYFKQIIKKFTGSKSKDSINLTTSPLDFWTFKMYILTPKFACIGQAQAKL